MLDQLALQVTRLIAAFDLNNGYASAGQCSPLGSISHLRTLLVAAIIPVVSGSLILNYRNRVEGIVADNHVGPSGIDRPECPFALAGEDLSIANLRAQEIASRLVSHDPLHVPEQAFL